MFNFTSKDHHTFTKENPFVIHVAGPCFRLCCCCCLFFVFLSFKSKPFGDFLAGFLWFMFFCFFFALCGSHLLLHVCYYCCCASVVCLFCLLLNGVKPHKTVARKHFNYVLHTFCSSTSTSTSSSPSPSFSFLCCCFFFIFLVCRSLDYNLY